MEFYFNPKGCGGGGQNDPLVWRMSVFSNIVWYQWPTLKCNDYIDQTLLFCRWKENVKLVNYDLIFFTKKRKRAKNRHRK